MREDGWEAAYQAALATWDDRYYLHDEWGKNGDYWPLSIGDLYSWDSSTWEALEVLPQVWKTYYETIQLHLNEAILHCAAAINLAADYYFFCRSYGNQFGDILIA